MLRQGFAAACNLVVLASARRGNGNGNGYGNGNGNCRGGNCDGNGRGIGVIGDIYDCISNLEDAFNTSVNDLQD